MDLANIRSQFAHLDQWLFLNHAGVSPIPIPVANAMHSFIDDVARNASANERNWWKREDELRDYLATLLNCHSSEIALTKNTSEGLSFVANGLQWREGDNVVISNVEFPANAYPWIALERKGVEVRFARERDDGRIPVEEVLSLVDSRTRVVALSLVQYASGYRMPAEDIGAYCRKHGIIFVLDVFQAAGALEVNVQKLQADVVASAFHKWLLGPEGLGFLYIRKDIMDSISVEEWGWKSVTLPYTSMEYKLDPKPDASRYECGTLNTCGIFGAAAALEFYLQIGIENAERRIIELTDRLCEELTKRGCKVFSPRGPNEKSGIVSFSHPRISAGEIVKHLANQRIIVSERAGRVRVAPHYYNTEQELERLLSSLSD